MNQNDRLRCTVDQIDRKGLWYSMDQMDRKGCGILWTKWTEKDVAFGRPNRQERIMVFYGRNGQKRMWHSVDQIDRKGL